MSIEVVSHKESVLRATEKAMHKSARMIGGSIAGHAVELAPRDTGLLANSITFAIGGESPQKIDYTSDGENKSGKKVEKVKGVYEGQADPDDPGQVTVYVGTNVEYAAFNELGTVKMEARPFLRPAFENNREEIKQILEQNFAEMR